MRLSRTLVALAALLAVRVSSLPTAGADSPSAADQPPNPDDLLGNIVVVAGAARPRPKIAVLPSLASAIEDVTVHTVVRRDLDLSSEFEVLPESAAPEGLYLSDTPLNVDAWRGKGAEALVRVSGKKLGADRAELRGQVYLVSRGATPVFDKAFSVPAAELREESHRLSDRLIGALTGQDGGFASRMIFASGSGGARRIYTIDSDGHDAKAVSPAGLSAIAPAFGKNGEIAYAAAAHGDPYAVRDATGKVVPIPYQGSVYGIAWSRDRSKVAVSLGVGASVKLFSGPDLAHLAPASKIPMALHPAFTPSGKLAFSGEGRWGQRIFVDDKPITPDGLFASSPVFCNHPDGVRAVFAVGAGKNTDLASTGERGGPLARLTQNQGQNGYPACSPDGRLIAFFSTRSSGQGPGLYVMRVDGGRPQRISSLLGDSLRWDALPAGGGREITR